MKITISNDKASAAVICRDLILDESQPSAAISSISPPMATRKSGHSPDLAMKGALEFHGKDIKQAQCLEQPPLQVIPNGRRVFEAYITPSSYSSFLISTSKADCCRSLCRFSASGVCPSR